MAGCFHISVHDCGARHRLQCCQGLQWMPRCLPWTFFTQPKTSTEVMRSSRLHHSRPVQAGSSSDRTNFSTTATFQM
eukprot:77894-Amphidinium_carterae.1